MKKTLVILTTHFGSNFSGGSTATCEIFSRLENQFEEIVVVGTQLGEHPFKSIRFIKYSYWFQAVKILKKQDQSLTLFYGDFYNSFLFIISGISFHFTYHDNWPELGKEGPLNGLRSLFYTNVYKTIFKRAESVITVSNFKYNFVKQFSTKPRLIPNGFNRSQSSVSALPINKANAVLMVGNIDKRKYSLALPLFKQLAHKDITIDIFGNVVDSKLADQLAQFPFVHIKGFIKPIPYSSYKLLLHTSISESFGMVFCEAIFQGIPVLAFDVGGAKELISSGNGTLIKPYDTNLMSQVLTKMLEQNINVSKGFLKEYSWDRASKSYLENFQLC